MPPHPTGAKHEADPQPLLVLQRDGRLPHRRLRPQPRHQLADRKQHLRSTHRLQRQRRQRRLRPRRLRRLRRPRRLHRPLQHLRLQRHVPRRRQHHPHRQRRRKPGTPRRLSPAGHQPADQQGQPVQLPRSRPGRRQPLQRHRPGRRSVRSLVTAHRPAPATTLCRAVGWIPERALLVARSIDAAPTTHAAVTKVLFHSYHYPPIGGSGAQRPLKMSRYLSELGYDLIVITGSGARVDRWAPKDETLASEIPPELVVRRLPAASEPETATRWEDRAERWLWMASPWVRWWVDESAKLGVDAGADADLIYVWMQPYASAAAGVSLSRKLGKPWVADLGDPWALDEMMVYPTRIHHRRELQRMEEMLSTASAIVMSTDEAVHRLLDRFPQFASKRVVAIPNGYDAADFERPVARRPGETFRIVQTGYLHTQLGREHRRWLPLRRVLGGSTQGLDIRTRSHVYVVEAINRLLARDPTLVSSLDFEIAGVLTEADREVAARCRVSRLHGYVTHAESIELIRTADLLFLPMQNLPPGVRATIVPGKTYEYL